MSRTSFQRTAFTFPESISSSLRATSEFQESAISAEPACLNSPFAYPGFHPTRAYGMGPRLIAFVEDLVCRIGS